MSNEKTTYPDMLGNRHPTKWDRILADIKLAAEPKDHIIEALQELKEEIRTKRLVAAKT